MLHPHQTPFSPSANVLVYHRINSVDTDPWGITVSPGCFEQQIGFLKQHCNLISLDELVQQLSNGVLLKNSVCITFDDGYIDNYTYARPILEKYDCPATFFLSTAFVGSEDVFWWDDLETIFLRWKKLPDKLRLRVRGIEHDYTLIPKDLTDEQAGQHKHWRWYDEPPSNRCAAFLAIWKILRPLPHEEISEHLNFLKQWSGLPDGASLNRSAMTEKHVLALSKNKLFTIGMHTHTHPDLKGKPLSIQRSEIETCKIELTKRFNIVSNLLSYPYGEYDEKTLQACVESGIEAAFTTQPESIYSHSNPFLLGRFQVFDDNREAFKAYFSFLV